MTNHIEEMMKTAGISDCKYCNYKMEECGCFYCNEVKYPDFTAEKQLEIIKLMINTSDFYSANDCVSSLTRDGSIEIYNQDFTQALAHLTTKLINEGELDKSKVKEILER